MKFTKEQWQIMIKEQKESGLSKAEFCKSKNIPSSTFHSVVSRLELKKNQSFFTKVKLEPRSLSDAKNLRLNFPQGIYREFPISSLSDVIETMNGGSL